MNNEKFLKNKNDYVVIDKHNGFCMTIPNVTLFEKFLNDRNRYIVCLKINLPLTMIVRDYNDVYNPEREYMFDCYICGKRYYGDGTDIYEMDVDNDKGGRCETCN